MPNATAFKKQGGRTFSISPPPEFPQSWKKGPGKQPCWSQTALLIFNQMATGTMIRSFFLRGRFVHKVASGTKVGSQKISAQTLLFDHVDPQGKYIYISTVNDRRKFRSQTSENMDRWKAEQGRGREKRKIRRKKSRRKKMQMRERVGKSRNTVFFQWFGAPDGRKVGSLKRRVRSQLARWEMKNCTPLWREAHFQVKMYKTHQCRTTFGSSDVEKVHAVVARSTCPSQNVQNTSASDHFWKLRCRKSARRCGAKYISKSKCTKHTSSGPLLAVEMSKKCTPLWREAHFQVKMYKTHQLRTTFGS